MNLRTPPLLLCLLIGIPAAHAQDSPDPRAVMPERPTVATHAWTVAPGYVELEAGFEWDRNSDDSHALLTPGVLKVGLAQRVQLGIAGNAIRPPQENLGMGDLSVGVKVRVLDRNPILGALAFQPTIKFPIADDIHGTGTTDVSLLLISSHRFGDVSLDLNAGYTRRSGDGSRAPRDATVWTVAGAVPLAGVLGLTAEVFGFPGTSGGAGSPGTVALLGGPVITVAPELVLDLGGILGLSGPAPDALYAGLVYNFGRL